ncbi:homoaconitate hydratase family protein [candidate division KSB1 bacterium]|nr:MAG: homoaconitate hydratase family protein [candidate division KSB1 bacterium]
MGKTIIEKIFSFHSEDEVKPGNIVWIKLDVRTARDFGGANVVKNFQVNYPGETIDDPKKTFFTFDCVAPANTIPYANNQQVCRIFAREQGIKVYDVDAGIGSHVAIEKGLVLPGYTFVGTDSHLNILGCIGAFGQGMGDQDIAFAFKTGKTWFEVPYTIKVTIKGSYSFPATAKDLTLAVVKYFGAKGALGKAIEYYGKCIDNLKLYERITLASMTTEIGGIISFITPDEEVLQFLKFRSGNRMIKTITADADANYVDEIEIDVSNLKPQISAPPKPENVFDVEDLKDVKIDSVFVGSCTNGRFEDFRVVADILKGRKVHKNVMMKITPATKEVYGQMLKEGILEILYDSGVIISHPGCGGCASGQLGMTGKGEVQVSTSNRNFKGKQGDGDTYIASPATAAASALLGRIASPEEVI